MIGFVLLMAFHSEARVKCSDVFKADSFEMYLVDLARLERVGLDYDIRSLDSRFLNHRKYLLTKDYNSIIYELIAQYRIPEVSGSSQQTIADRIFKNPVLWAKAFKHQLRKPDWDLITIMIRDTFNLYEWRESLYKLTSFQLLHGLKPGNRLLPRELDALEAYKELSLVIQFRLMDVEILVRTMTGVAYRQYNEDIALQLISYQAQLRKAIDEGNAPILSITRILDPNSRDLSDLDLYWGVIFTPFFESQP